MKKTATKKITLKNDFHNTEASFRLQPTEKAGIFSVSREVCNRVSRELCGYPDCCCGSEIDGHSGEDWAVVNIAYDRSLLVRVHAWI